MMLIIMMIMTMMMAMMVNDGHCWLLVLKNDG